MAKKVKKDKTKEYKSIKYYAKVYGISVLGEPSKSGFRDFKSVNKLSNDIYEYERANNVKNGMYPFLNIK
jgi:hypothetical protein